MLYSYKMFQSIGVVLALAVSGCQRSARQVVFENPCANPKEAASSKNCNKPTNTSGGTGTSSDDWIPSNPSNDSPQSGTSGSRPPTVSNNSGQPPLSGSGGSGGGSTPSGPSLPPSGGNGGSTGSNNQSGPSLPPLGGNTGSTGSNNQSGLPSSSSDVTATTKLGIAVTKQGVPTLIFNGGNQAKFTDMQYTVEPNSIVVPEASLVMQGLSNPLGQFGVKVSLTFKYENKSCTGSAVARLEQESAVTVKCP